MRMRVDSVPLALSVSELTIYGNCGRLSARGGPMKKKTERNVCWLIPIAMILIVLLTFGCAKKQVVSVEEKKEPSATVPQSQPPSEKPAPSKDAEPTATPGTVGPPAPQPVATAAPSGPEPGQDPITEGTALLNPTLSPDAQIIQSRFVELGLYSGAVDGIWGKGSRAALKSFKEQNSLADPDRWDKETQMRLFRETSPSTSQGPVASGSALLNPALPQHAKIIQSRLANLGFYSGPIDGIWGKGSKGALKSFKEQNSLSNPEKWDKETQVLLFQGSKK